MYQKEKISIREIFERKLTKEKSIKALRARADEGLLVLLGEEGRTRFYDKQLSAIRVNAARNCKNKHPKLTWGDFKRIFEKLDAGNHHLNEKIIGSLNNGSSARDVTKQVEEIVIAQLREDGFLPR